MTLEEIINLTWVPLLVFAICLFYGLWLVITKNPEKITNKKDPKPIKDPKMYALEGGKLLLGLAAASLVNCALLFINLYASLAEAVLAFVLFSIAWKKMNSQYGVK